MSNIKENIAIQIFNYNPFILSVNTNITSHPLQPCYDYNSPTTDYVTFAELSHVNSNSTAIRSGLVRFDKEKEKDIYEALQIRDWDNILTNQEIEEIILNPNKDKLQKIIGIMDSSIFDRVVAIYQALINSGEHDVSNRVMNIIDIRKSEFRKGQTVSSIQLKAKDDKTPESQVSSEEIESVRAQNDALQNQLNQMQEMMAKLLASQNTDTSTNPETEEDKTKQPNSNSNRGKKTATK